MSEWKTIASGVDLAKVHYNPFAVGFQLTANTCCQSCLQKYSQVNWKLSHFFTSSNFSVNQHQLTPSSSAGCTKAHSPRVLDTCTTATAISSRIASHSSRYKVLGIQIGADVIDRCKVFVRDSNRDSLR
ncbi:hypothetical protein L2E82_04721 [Cichorium intybus]|uniref:Uncharacterized protein n=1 Tax=Cichorium intybus TaxID=13427 RepID=A0ACB9H834_CICIN|nr:hypothetical protein L2E82_04721 [Cichorium intybus]